MPHNTRSVWRTLDLLQKTEAKRAVEEGRQLSPGLERRCDNLKFAHVHYFEMRLKHGELSGVAEEALESVRQASAALFVFIMKTTPAERIDAVDEALGGVLFSDEWKTDNPGHVQISKREYDLFEVVV